MATRSLICKRDSEGVISGVYCHHDGYPDHNGRILQENYKSKNKVGKLLNHGDMSILDERISLSKGESHSSYYDKIPGVSLFYHRDRGKEYRGPRPILNDVVEDGSEVPVYFTPTNLGGIEFVYIYDYTRDDGDWECYEVEPRPEGAILIPIYSHIYI